MFQNILIPPIITFKLTSASLIAKGKNQYYWKQERRLMIIQFWFNDRYFIGSRPMIISFRNFVLPLFFLVLFTYMFFTDAVWDLTHILHVDFPQTYTQIAIKDRGVNYQIHRELTNTLFRLHTEHGGLGSHHHCSYHHHCRFRHRVCHLQQKLHQQTWHQLFHDSKQHSINPKVNMLLN